MECCLWMGYECTLANLMPGSFHGPVNLIQIDDPVCTLWHRNQSQVTRYLFWKQSTNFPNTKMLDDGWNRDRDIACTSASPCLYRWIGGQKYRHTDTDICQHMHVIYIIQMSCMQNLGKLLFNSYKTDFKNFQENDL